MTSHGQLGHEQVELLVGCIGSVFYPRRSRMVLLVEASILTLNQSPKTNPRKPLLRVGQKVIRRVQRMSGSFGHGLMMSHTSILLRGRTQLLALPLIFSERLLLKCTRKSLPGCGSKCKASDLFPTHDPYP